MNRFSLKLGRLELGLWSNVLHSRSNLATPLCVVVRSKKPKNGTSFFTCFREIIVIKKSFRKELSTALVISTLCIEYMINQHLRLYIRSTFIRTVQGSANC